MYLVFLDRFPMTPFVTKAIPIHIIDFICVELLHKLTKNVYNLFNWSYRLHVCEFPQRWGHMHAHAHTHAHTHTHTHILQTNFKKTGM